MTGVKGRRIRMKPYIRQVRGKLNWLLFAGRVSDKALWVPAVVALPVLVFHLGLRRAFPVGPGLALAATGLLAWAAARVWRERYSEEDVLAYVDSWMGGHGEVLMGADPLNPQVLPRMRWGRGLRGWVPALLVLAFVCQIPVLSRAPAQQLAAHSTREWREQIEELGQLGLLTDQKEEELTALLEQFQEAAEQMTTDDFWRAGDRMEMRLDEALTEAQSSFETAAAEFRKWEKASAASAGLEAASMNDGGQRMEPLTEALAQAMQSLPEAAAMGDLSADLQQQLAEMMEKAKTGDLNALKEALSGLSAEELGSLAEHLASLGERCEVAREGDGGSCPGEGEEGQMAAMDADADADAGAGGISRDEGPGFSGVLFGEESPELQGAMMDALLPPSGTPDPGQLLERTSLVAAPEVTRDGWGRVDGSTAAGTGVADEGATAAEIAPRHRRAVGRYFDGQEGNNP